MSEVPLYWLDSGRAERCPRPGKRADQLLHRNVLRFRGGLVFKAHRLCVSLNSRLESNKEEEETRRLAQDCAFRAAVERIWHI